MAFIDAVKKIRVALDSQPLDKIASLDKSLKTLTIEELCVYQEWKSRMHMHGIMSYEDATVVYRILNDWGQATLPERVAVTTLMGQFAQMQKSYPGKVRA